jgi:SAM-dependent methyltransferase
MAGLRQQQYSVQDLSVSNSFLAKDRFLVPSRKEQHELMDEGLGTLAELRSTLNELWRINRFFGNVNSLSQYLKPAFVEKTQPLRIADLGTGSGKLALYLRDLARKHKRELQIYPVDFSSRVLGLAQENISSSLDIHLIQANALQLPFAPKSIDFFISSMFLHHFEPESLLELLGNAYEIAVHGIVMADIVRGILPLAAFRLIQPIFARQYLTHHDGLVSIRRAYIPEELNAIVQAAGIKNARVYQRFPWHMTLVAYKQYV